MYNPAERWKRDTLTALLGQTLTSVTQDDDEIRFITSTGTTYKLLHEQDCCEHVSIESIVGDLNDLVGSPILLAEESTNTGEPLDSGDESWTWTFYKFATIKGYVDIRWYGSSDGYYSESVDFVRIIKKTV